MSAAAIIALVVQLLPQVIAVLESIIQSPELAALIAKFKGLPAASH